MFLATVLAVMVSVASFSSFESRCGYVFKTKNNGGDKLIIAVGEFHNFSDVQKDVECLMKQLVTKYGAIEFIGIEGVSYVNGALYESTITKLDLGLPLIGLESGSRQERAKVIKPIDDRHAELAKKKLERGLTLEEHIEYEYITNQSYQLIVRKRSWEWVDNLNDFMTNTKKSVGIINIGFGHFWTLAEKFDQRGVSYVFILPNAAGNYVSCEAYWQKRKPKPELSTKAVCDDHNVKPFWD